MYLYSFKPYCKCIIPHSVVGHRVRTSVGGWATAASYRWCSGVHYTAQSFIKNYKIQLIEKRMVGCSTLLKPCWHINRFFCVCFRWASGTKAAVGPWQTPGAADISLFDLWSFTLLVFVVTVGIRRLQLYLNSKMPDWHEALIPLSIVLSSDCWGISHKISEKRKKNNISGGCVEYFTSITIKTRHMLTHISS